MSHYQWKKHCVTSILLFTVPYHLTFSVVDIFIFFCSEAEKALLRRHSDGDHMINLEDEMDQLLAEDQVNLLETDLTRNDDDLLLEMENCIN